MGHIQRSVVIHAPPREVYELLLDTSRFEEWVAGFAGLIDGPERVTDGSTYTWRFNRWRLRLRPRSTITALEPEQRIEERVGGVIRGTLVKSLRPQKRRTELHWEFDYRLPAGPVGNLADWLVARRIARRAMEDSLRGAKRVLEAQRKGGGGDRAKRRSRSR